MSGEYSEKFPEAFRRYEERVDTSIIKTFPELLVSFQSWGGKKSPLTHRQKKALALEGEAKLNIKPVVERVVHEKRGFTQVVYRDAVTGRFAKKPESND